MSSTKRFHHTSEAPTSLHGQSHRSPSYFSAQFRHPQSLENAQKRPKKRVTLHPPSRPPSTDSVRCHEIPVQKDSSSVADIYYAENVSGEDEGNINSLNEVIMCVDMRDRGTVGCCYYVAQEEKLSMMGDLVQGGIEVIEKLKVYIQPTVVMFSTRVDEAVEACLNFESRRRGFDDQFLLPYVVEPRPSSEFSYEAGKTKLINLDLCTRSKSSIPFFAPGYDDQYDSYQSDNEPGFTGRQGNFLRLSSCIDIESRLTVGCAGALLTYIGRRKAVESLPSEEPGNNSFRISKLDTFSLQGVMLVTADALASLQIMRSESSPNLHSQGPTTVASGSKEGLSVYGLFHHLARTPQGKQLLRQYFLRPSIDTVIINERLDFITTLLRPDNDGPMNKIVKSLKQIKNMRTVTINLRKGVSNGMSKGGEIKSGIWSSLRSFAFYTLQIKDALMEVVGVERLAIGTKVFEAFDVHAIAMLGRAISEKVDFTLSAEMHRTVINSGVDLELDEMKRNYDGLEDLLNHTSHQIAATVPAVYDLDLNVIFFPQIGFLISIPNNVRTGRGDYEGGEGEDQRWDRIFSTPSRIYYKDARMRALDANCGDIYASICVADKEIEIVHELGQLVLMREHMLDTVSDLCGELDSLLALAQGAKMYKLCRPRITEKNVVDIKAGRHPLQELTVPSYVPNDTFLVGASGKSHAFMEHREGETRSSSPPRCSPNTEELQGPSMLLMTGPNYSGKSVYLKQVAIIVYMAHVGSFVPADHAIIGLTDKILTKIATRESVSRPQSAFMIDLQQVALSMRLATCKSLVIFDELGKGTESNDGAGLACGVFEHLLSLGENRPKVLGATHFYEIFENGFLRQRPSLAFGHMEIRLEREAVGLEDQITYLYTFYAGQSTLCYGSCCAALNGVDKPVTDRANRLVDLSTRGEDLVAACAITTKEEEADLREAVGRTSSLETISIVTNAQEKIAREFLDRDLRQISLESTRSKEMQDPRTVLDLVTVIAE